MTRCSPGEEEEVPGRRTPQLRQPGGGGRAGHRRQAHQLRAGAPQGFCQGGLTMLILKLVLHKWH